MALNLGIMQPYFLPYIGYFQLIEHVDRFVVYDRIKYTKKGWINRNRMLQNGAPVTFSLPLAKAPDHLDVCERVLADSFDPNKFEAQITGAYSKAPEFDAVMPVLAQIIHFKSTNLFDFLFNSLTHVTEHLHIQTEFEVSSDLESDPELLGQDRVLALCQDARATRYTNPIGGTELYDPLAFERRGIDLRFLRTGDIRYSQFNNEFQPALSILDMMMFNPVDTIRGFLESGYTILKKDEV